MLSLSRCIFKFRVAHPRGIFLGIFLHDAFTRIFDSIMRLRMGACERTRMHSRETVLMVRHFDDMWWTFRGPELPAHKYLLHRQRWYLTLVGQIDQRVNLFSSPLDAPRHYDSEKDDNHSESPIHTLTGLLTHLFLAEVEAPDSEEKRDKWDSYKT